MANEQMKQLLDAAYNKKEAQLYRQAEKRDPSAPMAEEGYKSQIKRLEAFYDNWTSVLSQETLSAQTEANFYETIAKKFGITAKSMAAAKDVETLSEARKKEAAARARAEQAQANAGTAARDYLRSITTGYGATGNKRFEKAPEQAPGAPTAKEANALLKAFKASQKSDMKMVKSGQRRQVSTQYNKVLQNINKQMVYYDLETVGEMGAAAQNATQLSMRSGEDDFLTFLKLTGETKKNIETAIAKARKQEKLTEDETRDLLNLADIRSTTSKGKTTISATHRTWGPNVKLTERLLKEVENGYYLLTNENSNYTNRSDSIASGWDAGLKKLKIKSNNYTLAGHNIGGFDNRIVKQGGVKLPTEALKDYFDTLESFRALHRIGDVNPNNFARLTGFTLKEVAEWFGGDELYQALPKNSKNLAKEGAVWHTAQDDTAVTQAIGKLIAKELQAQADKFKELDIKQGAVGRADRAYFRPSHNKSFSARGDSAVDSSKNWENLLVRRSGLYRFGGGTADKDGKYSLSLEDLETGVTKYLQFESERMAEAFMANTFSGGFGNTTKKEAIDAIKGNIFKAGSGYANLEALVSRYKKSAGENVNVIESELQQGRYDAISSSPGGRGYLEQISKLHDMLNESGLSPEARSLAMEKIGREMGALTANKFSETALQELIEGPQYYNPNAKKGIVETRDDYIKFAEQYLEDNSTKADIIDAISAAAANSSTDKMKQGDDPFSGVRTWMSDVLRQSSAWLESDLYKQTFRDRAAAPSSAAIKKALPKAATIVKDMESTFKKSGPEIVSELYKSAPAATQKAMSGEHLSRQLKQYGAKTGMVPSGWKAPHKDKSGQLAFGGGSVGDLLGKITTAANEQGVGIQMRLSADGTGIELGAYGMKDMSRVFADGVDPWENMAVTKFSLVDEHGVFQDINKINAMSLTKGKHGTPGLVTAQEQVLQNVLGLFTQIDEDTKISPIAALLNNGQTKAASSKMAYARRSVFDTLSGNTVYDTGSDSRDALDAGGTAYNRASKGAQIFSAEYLKEIIKDSQFRKSEEEISATDVSNAQQILALIARGAADKVADTGEIGEMRKNERLMRSLTAAANTFIMNDMPLHFEAQKEVAFNKGILSISGSHRYSPFNLFDTESARNIDQGYRQSKKQSTAGSKAGVFSSDIGKNLGIDYDAAEEALYDFGYIDDEEIYNRLAGTALDKYRSLSTTEGGAIVGRSLADNFGAYRAEKYDIDPEELSETFKLRYGGLLTSLQPGKAVDFNNGAGELISGGAFKIGDKGGKSVLAKNDDVLQSFELLNNGKIRIALDRMLDVELANKMLTTFGQRVTPQVVEDSVMTALTSGGKNQGAQVLLEEKGMSEKNAAEIIGGRYAYMISEYLKSHAQDPASAIKDINAAIANTPVLKNFLQYDKSSGPDSPKWKSNATVRDGKIVYTSKSGGVNPLFENEGQKKLWYNEELSGSTISTFGKNLFGEKGYDSLPKLTSQTFNRFDEFEYNRAVGSLEADDTNAASGTTLAAKEKNSLARAFTWAAMRGGKSVDKYSVLRSTLESYVTDESAIHNEAIKNRDAINKSMALAKKVNVEGEDLSAAAEEQGQEIIRIVSDNIPQEELLPNEIPLSALASSRVPYNPGGGMNRKDYEQFSTLGILRRRANDLKYKNPVAVLDLEKSGMAPITVGSGLTTHDYTQIPIPLVPPSSIGKDVAAPEGAYELDAFLRSVRDSGGDESALLNEYYTTLMNSANWNKSPLMKAATKTAVPNSSVVKMAGGNNYQAYKEGAANKSFSNTVYVSPETLRDMLSTKAGSRSSDNIEKLQLLLNRLQDNPVKDFKPKLSGAADEEQQLIQEIISLLDINGNGNASAKTLLSNYFRYPSVSGLDLTFSRLGVDSSITNPNTARMYSGLAKETKTDFDGDIARLFIPIMNARTLNSKKFNKIYDEAEELTALEDETTRLVEVQTRQQLEADKAATEASGKIFSPDTDKSKDSIASILSKANFASVGKFSNVSSNVRMLLSSIGEDELAPGAPENKSSVGQAAIVRAFMMSLEQDAISAKKIKSRLSASGIEGEEEQEKFVMDELKTLYTDIRAIQDTSTEDLARKKWEPIIASMQKIGIIGETGLSSEQGRGLTQRMQAAGFTEDDFKSLGLSGSLTSEDEFNPLGGTIPIEAILKALVAKELATNKKLGGSISAQLGSRVFSYGNKLYTDMSEPLYTGGAPSGLQQGIANEDEMREWAEQRRQVRTFSRESPLAKARAVGGFVLHTPQDTRMTPSLGLKIGDEEDYITNWIKKVGEWSANPGAHPGLEGKDDPTKNALLAMLSAEKTASGEEIPIENRLALFDKVRAGLSAGGNSYLRKGSDEIMTSLTGIERGSSRQLPDAWVAYIANQEKQANEAGYSSQPDPYGKSRGAVTYSLIKDETAAMSTLSDVVENEHNPAYKAAILLEQQKGQVAQENAKNLGAEAKAFDTVTGSAQKTQAAIESISALEVHKGANFDADDGPGAHAYYEGKIGSPETAATRVMSVSQLRSALEGSDPRFAQGTEAIRTAAKAAWMNGELGSVTAAEAQVNPDDFGLYMKSLVTSARGVIGHATVQALSEFETATGIKTRSIEELQTQADSGATEDVRNAAIAKLHSVEKATSKYDWMQGIAGFDKSALDMTPEIAGYMANYQSRYGDAPLAQYSEQVVAATVKINGELYKIAGEFDQIFFDMENAVAVLSDNKFTGQIKGFFEAFQLSLYNMLLSVADLPGMTPEMKAILNNGVQNVVQHVKRDKEGNVVAETQPFENIDQNIMAGLITRGMSNAEAVALGHPEQANYLTDEEKAALDTRAVTGFTRTVMKPEPVKTESYGETVSKVLKGENIEAVLDFGKKSAAIKEYNSNLRKQENIVTKIADASMRLNAAEGADKTAIDEEIAKYQEELSKIEEIKAAIVENNKLNDTNKDDILAAEAHARNRINDIFESAGIKYGEKFSTGGVISDQQFKSISGQYIGDKRRYGNIEVEEARLNRALSNGDLKGDRASSARARLAQTTQEKARLSPQLPSIETTYDANGKVSGGVVSVYDAATGASQKYSLSVQQLNWLLEQEAKLTYDLEGRLSSASRATLKSQSLFSAVIGGLKNSMRNMIDYQLAGRIVGSVQQGIQKLIQTATQLDSAFTDLAIASDKTRAQIYADFTEYNNLAVKVGSTTTEVAKAANDWLRAGYEGQEAMSLTEASMRLSVLGMEDATSATSQLISVLKGWKIESTEVMGVVDKLTAIDMNAAISAGELAEGMSQANNMARESGMSLNTFAGAVATVVDVSQMDPNRVGNAMRTAMSRYSNVKAGKFAASADDMESEDYAAEDWVALNDTETVMKSMGLTIREDVNTFKSYEDVLSETAARWSEFTDVERSAIGTAMAGTRQREAFLVLMQNWDQVVRLATVAEDSLGTSEKKMGIYTESLGAAQARVTAAIEEWTSKLKASKKLIWFNNSLADIIKNLHLLIPLLGSAAALTNFGSLTEWFGGRVASHASKLGYGVNVPGAGMAAGAASGGIGKLISENFLSGYNEKLSDVFSGFLGSFSGRNALGGKDAAVIQGAYDTLLGSANSSAVQNLFSKFKEGANSADTVAAAFKDLATSADDTVSAEVKSAAAVVAGVDSKIQEKIAADMAASATLRFRDALLAVGAKILATTGGAMLGGAIGKLTGDSSGVGTILGGVAGNLLPDILSKAGLAEKIVSKVSGIAGAVAGVVGIAINAYLAVEQKKLEEANKNYEAATETLSKAAAAKTNIKEYDELAAGVDRFGENLTLTDDEYERFKSLSTQLAEAYPALKVRTNELGESFVGLNDKVGALGDVTAQYNDSLLASAEALTDPTLTKSLYKAATEDSSDVLSGLRHMLYDAEKGVTPYDVEGNTFTFTNEDVRAKVAEELEKNNIKPSKFSDPTAITVSGENKDEAAAIIKNYIGSAEKIQGLIDLEYANLAAQNADLVKIGIARMRVYGTGSDKKYDDMSEGEQNFITSSIQTIDTTDMLEQEWQDTVDSLAKSISTVFAENPAIVDIMYEVDDSASVNSVVAARDLFMNKLLNAFKTDDGIISTDEKAILLKWGFEYDPSTETVSDVGNYISQLKEMAYDKNNANHDAAATTLASVNDTDNGIAYNDVAYALELLNNGIITNKMDQATIARLIKQAKYSDMSVGKLAGEIERLQDTQKKIDNSVDGVYSEEYRRVVASNTTVAENALMDYAEALGYTREELAVNVKLMAEFIDKAKAMGSITPYGGVTTAPDRVRSEYEKLLGYQSTLISGGKLSNEEIEEAITINPDIAAAVASGDWDVVRTAVDQAIANSNEKYRLALGETYMSGPNFSAENWGEGTDLWGSAVAGFGGDFTNAFANDFETLKLFSNQLNSAYDASGKLVNPTQLSSAKTTLMSGVANIFGLTGFSAEGTIDEQIASFMTAYDGAGSEVQTAINTALGTDLSTDPIFSDPTFWTRMFGGASAFNTGLMAFINNVFAGVTLAPTFSEKLAGVTKEIDAVNTAYDEFASNGKLTYSNLEGIRTEFASAMDADSLEHYIGLLSDANLTYEEMRTILGQMTRDGIERALSNQEIIDMGKDQLALYLKEKGIKDAEAVASELIIDSKVEEIQLTEDYAKLLEGNTEITIEGLEKQFGIEEDIAKVVYGRIQLEKQGQKLQDTATAIRNNPDDAAGGGLLDDADFAAQTAEAQEYVTALYGVGAGAAFAKLMTIMFDETGIDTEADVAAVNALSAAFLNEAGSAALADATKKAYETGGVVDPAIITDMLKNFQLPIFTTGGGGGGGSEKDRLREVLDQLEAIQELLDKDIYLMDEFNASADGVAGAMSRISEALKLVDIQSTGDYFADAAALYEKLADEYQVYYDAELKKGTVDDESELEFMTRMLGIQKEMNDLVKEKNDLDDEEVTDSIELAELMNTAFDAMYAYKLELMETADTTKEYLEYLKEARDLLSEQYGALIGIQQTWNDMASTNLENLSNANVFTPEGLSDVKGEFLDMLKSTSKGVDLIIGEFDSVVGQLGTDIQEQMKQGIASDSLKAFYKKYFREVFSAASLDLTSAGSFDAGVDYSSLMMGAKSYDEFVKYATLRESKIKSSGADVKAQGWKTTDEIYNQWATNNEGLAANGQELTDSLLHLKTVLSAKTASDPAAAFDAMQSFVAEAQAAGVSADVIQQLLEMTTSLSDTMDQYAENFTTIMDKFEESMDESESHLEALGTLTTKQKYENAALRVEQARDMKQAAYEAGYLTESLQETINKYISDTHDEMIGLMRDYQDEVQTAMIDSVNEYISALEKEKESTTEYYDDMLDKLNRVNDAKKESVRLEELQRNLRNAQQEKSRVYTEGVGWTYQANRSKISEAEDELDSYYLTQRISDLENSKDNELKALDDSIQNWNDYIDALEAAYDETNSIRQADLLMSEWGVTTKSELYKKTLEDRESFIEQFESGNEKYLGYMRDFYEEVKKYLGLFGEVYSAEANLGTVSGGLSVGNLDSGLSYDASVDYAALMLKAKSQAEFDYYAALRTAKANGEGINISGTENGGFKTNDQLQSAWSTPTTVTTTTTTTTTTPNTKTNPTPGPAPAPKKAVPTPGPAPAPKKAVPTPEPAPAPPKVVPTPGPAPGFLNVVLIPGPAPAPPKAVPTPEPGPAPQKAVYKPGPAPAAKKAADKPQEYATGLDAGPVTYTGLSMLHGTPSNPEYVLTNDQAYNILSNLGATTKTPKFETAGGSRGNSYNISGDVVITNPIGPNEFWSTLAQNVSTRFSVTKENLKRG